MAWTQADLDKLDRAIASGVKMVEYDGGKRLYQSTDDMLKARALIAIELAKESNLLAGRPTRRMIRILPRLPYGCGGF